MQYQFIFKEQNVKDLAPISQNVAGEYLASAMYEAQAIDLKRILGSRLLKKLQECERVQDVEPQYEDLKEQCLSYLVYRTIVRLIPKVQYKIANAGAFTTNDEKLQPITKEQTDSLVESYVSSADSFAHELQLWLCNNSKAFPELDECQCAEIKSNLKSFASCGIWLGGFRGNILGGGCCR